MTEQDDGCGNEMSAGLNENHNNNETNEQKEICKHFTARFLNFMEDLYTDDVKWSRVRGFALFFLGAAWIKCSHKAIRS